MTAPPSLADCRRQVYEATSEREALALLHRALEPRGFCKVAFVLMPRQRNLDGTVPEPKFALVWPEGEDPESDAWVRTYARQKGFSTDFAYQAAQNTTLPFAWTLGDTGIQVLGPQLRLMAVQMSAGRECKQRTGVCGGVTVPLYLPDGSTGYLSAMTREEGRVEQARDEGLLDELMLAAHRFSDAVRQLQPEEVTVTSLGDTQLSRREVDCLKWAASGKSLEEIASIVGISYATVRFHLGNAERKLGTATRAHAIAKAVHLGLVSPT